MDKIRAFLAILYQQRFWVLSVIGVLVAVVCWMLSSNKLEQEYAKNQSAIVQQFNTIGTLNSSLIIQIPR
jgi:hypothetical protein